MAGRGAREQLRRVLQGARTAKTRADKFRWVTCLEDEEVRELAESIFRDARALERKISKACAELREKAQQERAQRAQQTQEAASHA